MATNLHLEPVSASNKLPNTCNKEVAQHKAAKKLSEILHNELVSEIACRDMMDYIEENDDIESASDEEGEFGISNNEDSDNSE
jgi:hypothetical protein